MGERSEAKGEASGSEEGMLDMWPPSATLGGRSDGRGKDPGGEENSTRRGLDGVLLVALVVDEELEEERGGRGSDEDGL